MSIAIVSVAIASIAIVSIAIVSIATVSIAMVSTAVASMATPTQVQYSPHDSIVLVAHTGLFVELASRHAAPHVRQQQPR